MGRFKKVMNAVSRDFSCFGIQKTDGNALKKTAKTCQSISKAKGKHKLIRSKCVATFDKETDSKEMKSKITSSKCFFPFTYMKAFKSKSEAELIKSTPGICAAPLKGILKPSNAPSVQNTVSFCNKVVTNTIPCWDNKCEIPYFSMSNEEKDLAKSEMNYFKQNEMDVHPSSFRNTDLIYHGKREERKAVHEMKVEALKSDLFCPQMDTEDCCQDSDIDWDSDESMTI